MPVSHAPLPPPARLAAVFAASVVYVLGGAPGAFSQSSAEAEPDGRGTRIGALLADGFEIIDYEVGSISINRFQAFERILLVKDAAVFTCALSVEAGADGPRKVSVCTQVH